MHPTARPNIVWFKRDLRTVDHRPLAEASARGPVIPLLVVEPELWMQPDASHRQYAFMRECAAELDEALGLLGTPLVVRSGRVVDVLADLRRHVGFTDLWSHEETGNAWTYRRDLDVAAWCRDNGITWHELPQNGVVRRLKSRNGWAKRWDRHMAQPITAEPKSLDGMSGIELQPIPTPEILGLAFDGCTEPQRGGRRAAISHLTSFLDVRGQTYRRAMSSPLTGADGCSRLSPYLAWGAISMREVAQANWARQRSLQDDTGEGAKAWRGSLVSFSGRLHWHCHFMQKLESEPSIETTELHPVTRGLRPRPGDAALLDAWTHGRTGFPFVDACMRSLRTTGWINFRMRAMLVSFASYNLWLPWQETGLVLARLFTDYEPGIHWPQMQMQSGTTGINTIRLYNPVKQGHDQDPDGVFVRRWVQELAAVPDSHRQEPSTWSGAADVIGKGYPPRIVDLAATTAAAKDRIYGSRRAAGFRDAADAIQARHGSRKSGTRMTGQKRTGKRGSAKPVDQFEFEL
ncbi:MAG: FAD-binding domain-containing protein [Hyphomicrobiaceae bacterium]